MPSACVTPKIRYKPQIPTLISLKKNVFWKHMKDGVHDKMHWMNLPEYRML